MCCASRAAHKRLNVTYDCGIALVRRTDDLRRTFAATAGYLPPSDAFEAMHHTPQSSQRARQIEVWSVLRTSWKTDLDDARFAADAILDGADRVRTSR